MHDIFKQRICYMEDFMQQQEQQKAIWSPQKTYIKTASFGLFALMNSTSASENLPSSSRYTAYLLLISDSFSFIAIFARSNAKSNTLQQTKQNYP